MTEKVKANNAVRMAAAMVAQRDDKAEADRMKKSMGKKG